MRVMVKSLGERLGERLVETERSDKKLSEIKIINWQLPSPDEWLVFPMDELTNVHFYRNC